MSPAEYTVAITMACLVVCSGAVSGSETAYFSLDPARIETLGSQRERLGHLVARLMIKPARLLLVILICNNVINLTYFSLAGWWAAHYTDEPAIAAGIALGALATLILCGEIVPKVLASGAPERYAKLLALPMWLLGILLGRLCQVLEKLLGPFLDEETSNPGVTADELKLVIERSRDSGVVSELVHDRLQDVVDLSSTPAVSAMTHRVDLPTVRQNASEEDAIQALRATPSPFLLVMDEGDNCVGVVSAQALLRGGRPSKRMNKPLFIPAAAQLSQVLELFRDTRRTAGVVVDEYGGTLGLLTLPHIANELLGPGTSADLPDQPDAEQLGPATWRLSGVVGLEAWKPLLEDSDIAGCTTVGGFLAKMLGAVPQPGDRLLYNNLLFQVDAVAARRITSITVEKIDPKRARRMTQGRLPPGPLP